MLFLDYLREDNMKPFWTTFNIVGIILALVNGMNSYLSFLDGKPFYGFLCGSLSLVVTVILVKEYINRE